MNYSHVISTSPYSLYFLHYWVNLRIRYYWKFEICWQKSSTEPRVFYFRQQNDLSGADWSGWDILISETGQFWSRYWRVGRTGGVELWEEWEWMRAVKSGSTRHCTSTFDASSSFSSLCFHPFPPSPHICTAAFIWGHFARTMKTRPLRCYIYSSSCQPQWHDINLRLASNRWQHRVGGWVGRYVIMGDWEKGKNQTLPDVAAWPLATDDHICYPISSAHILEYVKPRQIETPVARLRMFHRIKFPFLARRGAAWWYNMIANNS